MELDYKIFEKLMDEKGVTTYKVCKETGITQSALSSWKLGKSTPKLDKVSAIADYFDVSLDYLAGKSEFRNKEEMLKFFDDKFLTPELVEEANRPDGQVVGWTPTLTEKDEKDIQKKLDDVLNQLDNETGLMFDGEIIDEETKRKLRISLETVMRGARQEAKEKFTPKKYKK